MELVRNVLYSTVHREVILSHCPSTRLHKHKYYMLNIPIQVMYFTLFNAVKY